MTQTLILVTILLITQVTELKLLFETQVSQHRFYYVIMASLITCIVIEIVIGLVTVYVTQKRFDIRVSVHTIPKTKDQETTSLIYNNTASGGQDKQCTSGSDVRNIFSISGTYGYPNLSRPSQYLGQVTQVVTSQIRSNLPFIDSPGTSCSSFSQKLATIPEDSVNSAVKHDDGGVRLKVEDDDDDNYIASHSSCPCCFNNHKRSLCDKDLLKSWHNLHFYLLYLIMVLNVFITAFGLSGENMRAAPTSHD